MRLREKGKKDAEPVGMGWDEAQAALRAGTHEIAEDDDVGAGDKPKEAAASGGAEGSAAAKDDGKASRSTR